MLKILDGFNLNLLFYYLFFIFFHFLKKKMVIEISLQGKKTMLPLYNDSIVSNQCKMISYYNFKSSKLSEAFFSGAGVALPPSGSSIFRLTLA